MSNTDRFRKCRRLDARCCRSFNRPAAGALRDQRWRWSTIRGQFLWRPAKQLADHAEAVLPCGPPPCNGGYRSGFATSASDSPLRGVPAIGRIWIRRWGAGVLRIHFTEADLRRVRVVAADPLWETVLGVQQLAAKRHAAAVFAAWRQRA